MDRIYRLAHEFRVAMNRANDAGLFKQIMRFEDFPRGSCGDTCYLLAEYLLEHNIYTEYVCGTKWPQSHAWLVVTTKEELEQKRIAKNKKRIVVSEHSNGYEYILSLIENNKISEIECSEPDFASKLENRTIIDITGDQFRYSEEFLYYKVPVYVGPMDEMHHIFSIDSVHECTGLSGIGTLDAKRMHSLYSIIKQFL